VIANAFVFLDFDGVINRITDTGYAPPHPSLAPELVNRVDRLAACADATVVVSSSWRENYSVPELAALLKLPSLSRRLVDVTPIYERVPKKKYVRAAEVNDWMASHGGGAPFVILDDAARHGFDPARFVHINGKLGITDTNVDAALDILRQQGAPIRQ
jgi:hypothetical protein